MIEFIDEPGLISPDVGKCKLGTDVAVFTFSDHLFDILINDFRAVPLCKLSGCAALDVYAIEAGGKRIAVYQSPIGAPAAAAALEVMIASGIDHAVAYGICGALTDVPPRTLIVPTHSYRDEGTSYHYLPASETIKLTGSSTVAAHLKASGVSVLEGGAWTTDGFYRETRKRTEYMKSRGCVAVDMECSALQALCDYRRKSFYTFFISADSLAGEEWDPNYILGENGTRELADVTATHIAVELAKALAH